MANVVQDLAKLVVKAAEDKKAEDIVVLDIRHLTPIAECFVICHGKNERQVQAIVAEIRDQAHKHGYHVRGVEGAEEGRWVLIDLMDVVVHVFHHEEREFYNIERLWADANRVVLDGQA